MADLVDIPELNPPKPTNSPLPTSMDSFNDTDVALCNVKQHARYRSMIGSLLWLATWTRPDISYAVGILSRKLHAPTINHYNLAIRVFRYLSHTKEYGITYRQSAGLQVQTFMHSQESSAFPPTVPLLYAYADASFADCIDSRRSTSGWLIILSGGVVAWLSKR